MSLVLASALLGVGSAVVVAFALWVALTAWALRGRFLAHRAVSRASEMEGQIEAMRSEIAAREGSEALLKMRVAVLARQRDDLEQFAHIASHDLRAPLRAIANLAEWIDEDAGETLSTDSREHLTLLRTRVARLQRLLRDLLSYSRAGRGEIEIADADLSVLVAEIGEDLGSENLDLCLNLSESLPTLETAVAPLRQVIANLVSNAVKHHDRERASVTIDVSSTSDWLTLAVADDGPGIDPSLFVKATTMFQTLKPRDDVDSTGMGLALVKRLVESCGGDLSLASPVSDGRGLAVTVTWPLRWPETR